MGSHYMRVIKDCMPWEWPGNEARVHIDLHSRFYSDRWYIRCNDDVQVACIDKLADYNRPLNSGCLNNTAKCQNGAWLASCINIWTLNSTFAVQHTIQPHPPRVLPEFWPSRCKPPHPLLTTSAAGSLDAGAVAGDHKTVAWNQCLDACMHSRKEISI